jgi:electron transfer flavoprotein alpha subunit
MDQQAGHLSEQSKRVLGEGRRVASHLGATLYGVTAEPAHSDESWISDAGLGGADKLVLLSNVGEGDFVSTLSMGAALAELCSTLKPNLILLAESADARMIGGALAARLGALFVADAITELNGGGALSLCQRHGNRLQERTIAASDVAVPVVATISVASVSKATGLDDADLIFFRASQPTTGSYRLTQSTVRNPSLANASCVVTAGLGAKDLLPQVDALAACMGATRASTRSLWEAGLADEESVVDWTRTRIAPRLCIICGASGSASHLAAISSGTTIVALGSDPMSPAIRAAQFALIGDLASTLPALAEEALRKQEPLP